MPNIRISNFIYIISYPSLKSFCIASSTWSLFFPPSTAFQSNPFAPHLSFRCFSLFVDRIETMFLSTASTNVSMQLLMAPSSIGD
ncbi:hypothetical protein VNO77_30381 [Canavalia gladiata]|uniref:Uncharacterized protein n=1 Tax=Canavalia gladiata TaxID=3824 RepID=A0AAN9KR12_CANGL